MKTKKVTLGTRKNPRQLKKRGQSSSDVLLTGEELVAYLRAGESRVAEMFQKPAQKTARPAAPRG